jgi:hypothetical protein
MLLLAEADRYLGDVVALEAAKSLMTDRLREGHVQAIEGHLRALIAGLGWQEAVAILDGLASEIAADLGPPPFDPSRHGVTGKGLLDLSANPHLAQIGRDPS